MIPLSQKISLSLLAAAMWIFFLAYYHNWYMGPVDFEYTERVVAITSALSTNQPVSSPVMTSEGYHLNEYRIVIGMFALSVMFALSGAAISIRHRLQYGSTQLFVPITFVSVVAAACIIKVGYDFSLHLHA